MSKSKNKNSSIDRRKQIEKSYKRFYQKLVFRDTELQYLCFYCGDYASTIDHQPPLSVFENFVLGGCKFEAVQVPCCSDCNSRLGAAATKTLKERITTIKAKLKTKFKKLSQVHLQWKQKEVDDLGYILQRTVLAKIADSKKQESRINYPTHQMKIEEYIPGDEYILCVKCGHIFELERGICPQCLFKDNLLVHEISKYLRQPLHLTYKFFKRKDYLGYSIVEGRLFIYD